MTTKRQPDASPLNQPQMSSSHSRQTNNNSNNNGKQLLTESDFVADLDDTSTYTAISSLCQTLQRLGRRGVDAVSKKELDTIITLLEGQQIDLTNISSFSYDAPDLTPCLRLLARLQNRCTQSGSGSGLRENTCTIRDIVEDTLVDRSSKAHRYDIGEWVEVRGPSMRFRLEIIQNIVKKDDELLYETSVDHNLTTNEIRWPREALRRIFGMGPWVWRQWACLKLEHRLRFQEGHPDDIDCLNVLEYANDLWDLWLADDRNETFRALYERVGESGQKELRDHIMSPFHLIHEVTTNFNDKWNLEDAGVSIFTYVSLLGSGFADAAVVFLLQLFMPLVLFLYYTSEDREDDDVAVGTREMLFAVVFFYLYKVTRGTGVGSFVFYRLHFSFSPKQCLSLSRCLVQL